MTSEELQDYYPPDMEAGQVRKWRGENGGDSTGEMGVKVWFGGSIRVERTFQISRKGGL